MISLYLSTDSYSSYGFIIFFRIISVILSLSLLTVGSICQKVFKFDGFFNYLFLNDPVFISMCGCALVCIEFAELVNWVSTLCPYVVFLFLVNKN